MCGEVPWQGAAEKVSDNPSNTYIFISYWIIYLLFKHSKGSCYLFSLSLFRTVVCLVACPKYFRVKLNFTHAHTRRLILHIGTRCNVHCSFSMASTAIISDRQFQRITFAAMLLLMLSLWTKKTYPVSHLCFIRERTQKKTFDRFFFLILFVICDQRRRSESLTDVIGSIDSNSWENFIVEW